MYVLTQASSNRRFNNKTFTSYEQARQYARRWITKNVGMYMDKIGDFFSVKKVA